MDVFAADTSIAIGVALTSEASACDCDAPSRLLLTLVSTPDDE
jgi:hypothetical protein